MLICAFVALVLNVVGCIGRILTCEDKDLVLVSVVQLILGIFGLIGICRVF